VRQIPFCLEDRAPVGPRERRAVPPGQKPAFGSLLLQAGSVALASAMSTLARRRALLFFSVAALAGACAEAPRPAPPAAAPEGPRPAATEAQASGAPKAEKRPTVSEYQGTVKVTDDYQWLEKADDPAVTEWTLGQSRHARGVLDALPAVPAIRERVTALITGHSADHFALVRRGSAVFALKVVPPQEQPLLVTLTSVDDPASAKIVLDPNQLDKTGKTAIDFFVPSLDGKKVAVSLSRGGSERGDVHVYEAATGKELPDVVSHVNGGTAGGSLSWNADGTGFYYTRYPRPGERAPEDMDFYQQVYFHELGTPEARDRYMIGKDFPRIAEVFLKTSDDGQYVLATVENGDGGEFAHYLMGPSKTWTQISQLSDKVTEVGFGRSGLLYLLSKNGAPRGKILRLRAQKPALSEAETVVPESEATIESFTATDAHLVVVDLLGGPSQIRLFDLDGHPQGKVPIPNIASAGRVVRLGGDEAAVRLQTYVDPPAVYRFSGAGPVTRTKLFTTSPADFSDAEVVREMCSSKDGTKVPLNIIRKKGTPLDRKNPTLLYGYGGYGVSEKPGFGAWFRVWIEQGGVVAIANLRGGGEFGEEWHKAGSLTRKQNVFDDFAACAQHLADAGYTSPARLAILGGSNGGLLMGAMITQHPEMFRAAVSHVGIYDMLRVELSPNGAFNVTEFGSVKDPEQFKALYAYSPYHHVKDGAPYPAVLLTTGLNDPRVEPWQSRKMAARLQAATSSKLPVLLVAKSDAGHGVGGSLSDVIQQEVDMFAFLFQALGVTYKEAGKAR
jgi:prolyl oligopeptidase